MPFFFKGWGEWVHPSQATEDVFRKIDANCAGTVDMGKVFRVGKRNAGRMLDGREHNDLPWRAEL